MKYIDEFRDGALAQHVARSIKCEADAGRSYRIMEFCGGHTHAIHRYGIHDLLPANVRMIHGPGCPVCVLPMNRIDQAIDLALQRDVILCTYGDMLRVPGSPRELGAMSLLRAKAQGADIRMVYATSDALDIARQHPQREVVFFAIGFETTTPPTAVALQLAKAQGLTNFSVLCNHVLTPVAMRAILTTSEPDATGCTRIDGFIGPAHVSTVIGSRPYETIATEFRKPIVIAGFEPLDVMQAILMLLRQLNTGRADVENEFTRAVTRDGNLKAQRVMSEVFALRDQFEWRGLGNVPYSGLRINDSYAEFDAERRFALTVAAWQDHKACECAAVLRGVTEPHACKLFGTVCTPDTPVGPCMVSSEGACAAHYTYGRVRLRKAASGNVG